MKKYHNISLIILVILKFINVLRKSYACNILGYIKGIKRFVNEYYKFKAVKNPRFNLSPLFFLPYMRDNTANTPLEPTYFFQDTWAARKINENKPVQHYDFGSSAMTIGVISQFVPTTMIDIRPIDLVLEGLSFIEGSILAIPFGDNTLHSVSSLCVVEHIGLGRYGDPIDAFGSEKAAKELQRVLAKNGILFFSVPVDCECRIYFNAHRAFTRDYILEMFADLKLVEEKYHYGRKLYDSYDPKKGFGTGLFFFKKA